MGAAEINPILSGSNSTSGTYIHTWMHTANHEYMHTCMHISMNAGRMSNFKLMPTCPNVGESNVLSAAAGVKAPKDALFRKSER